MNISFVLKKNYNFISNVLESRTNQIYVLFLILWFPGVVLYNLMILILLNVINNTFEIYIYMYIYIYK